VADRSPGAGRGEGRGEPSSGLSIARAGACGPDEADLIGLARAFVERRGWASRCSPMTARVSRPRALLSDDTARHEGPTFEEWLGRDDAAALAL
jgi:hypothetical protein